MKIMNVKFAESLLEDLKRLLLKMWKLQKRLANIIEILNKSHWEINHTVKVKKKKKKNRSWEFGWERRLLGCSGTLTWKKCQLERLWFCVLKNVKRRSADRLACLTHKICYALTQNANAGHNRSTNPRSRRSKKIETQACVSNRKCPQCSPV